MTQSTLTIEILFEVPSSAESIVLVSSALCLSCSMPVQRDTIRSSFVIRSYGAGIIDSVLIMYYDVPLRYYPYYLRDQKLWS